MNTWALLLVSDNIGILLRLINLACVASHNENEGSEATIRLREKEKNVVDLQLLRTHAQQTREHINSFTYNSIWVEDGQSLLV